MVGVRRVDVLPLLGGHRAPGSTARKATGIRDRGEAWCPPRVMAIDIVLGVALSVAVHGDCVVRKLANEPFLAKIGLAAET